MMPELSCRNPGLFVSILERNSILVNLTLLGLVIYFTIDFPSRIISLTLFGSPLTLLLSQRLLMALILGGLVSTGLDEIIRSHPQAIHLRNGEGMVFWITPAGIAIATALTLTNLIQSPLFWILGLLFAGIILWLTVLAEYHLLDTVGPRKQQATIWLTIVNYSLAVAMFAIIYQTRSRSAVSATMLALTSGLLCASLLHICIRQLGKILSISIVTGLIFGEMTWALNFWRIKPFAGALLLSLLFYLVTGIAEQYLANKLNPRSMVEFLLVSVMLIYLINFFIR